MCKVKCLQPSSQFETLHLWQWNGFQNEWGKLHILWEINIAGTTCWTIPHMGWSGIHKEKFEMEGNWIGPLYFYDSFQVHLANKKREAKNRMTTHNDFQLCLFPISLQQIDIKAGGFYLWIPIGCYILVTLRPRAHFIPYGILSAVSGTSHEKDSWPSF